MKKKLILIVALIALVLSMNVVAQSDVQVILKSQNLGLDNNFGVYRAVINITTNKIGNLTYRESFYEVDYSSGTAGSKTLFKTSSYNVAMNDYSVQFGVTRPGLKSERDAWNTIIATVIIDGDVVYETQISQSGTYKSFTTGKANWVNDSSVTIGKTRPTIEKKPGPQFTATVEEKNVSTTTAQTPTDMTDPKQTPMLETSVIFMAIFMVYVFMRKRRR